MVEEYDPGYFSAYHICAHVESLLQVGDQGFDCLWIRKVTTGVLQTSLVYDLDVETPSIVFECFV